MSRRPCLPVAVAVAVLAATSPLPAQAAMCGCDKPPPKHAVVRPAFASAHWPIVIFHPALVPGRAYHVTFSRRVSPEDRPARYRSRRTKKPVTAILAKDQADFRFEELDLPESRRTPIQPKPQLRVNLLALGSPGYRGITVTDAATGAVVFSIPEESHAFLEIGRPIVLRPDTVHDAYYVTAVDDAGYMYLALDLKRILDPTIITGTATGDAERRLLPEHVVGYNAQGYNFDSLANVPKDPTRFGWQIIPSDGQNSETLKYWRHSFREWKESHDHNRGRKRLAPEDSYYWHADGTPHVDHERLVVAIREDFFWVRKTRRLGPGRRTIKLNIRTETAPNFVAEAGR